MDGGISGGSSSGSHPPNTSTPATGLYYNFLFIQTTKMIISILLVLVKVNPRIVLCYTNEIGSLPL